jgi:hypothetical protein
VRHLYQHSAGITWQPNYFGATGLDPLSLDPLGRTLLDDWLNGWDPNIIRSTLSVTNKYVNGTGVPVGLNILGGAPSYMKMLVNETNAAATNWQAFTSTNLWVPTPTDGSYVINVGLCGLATNATPSWQSVTVRRDDSPLILMLTNFGPWTGSSPYTDPAGYTTRALKALTWTVENLYYTNNGYGSVVAASWDLADRFHTTNWFQCLDLPLESGANQISIQAVDWLGNVAVTNYTYWLNCDPDRTPVLNLVWPTCSKSYFVNGNMLTNDATTAWWVSGGVGSPHSYSVKLTDGLFFQNGQYVSLHEEGRINMRRPIATIKTMTTEVNFVVAWNWSSEVSKGSSGWELINPSHSVNPTDSPTETYPLWRQKMNTEMTPRHENTRTYRHSFGFNAALPGVGGRARNGRAGASDE